MATIFRLPPFQTGGRLHYQVQTTARCPTELADPYLEVKFDQFTGLFPPR